MKKWVAYLCTHVLLSISNVSSRFLSTLPGVLYPQTILLEIYRGVGYVCLILVAVNAGHINPHLRMRTLSGRGLNFKLKLAYMRLRGVKASSKRTMASFLKRGRTDSVDTYGT